jgi:hypothetical protein
MGDQRDPMGDQRDPMGDQRDPMGNQIDPMGNQIDPMGNQRDPMGNQRDPEACMAQANSQIGGTIGDSRNERALTRQQPPRTAKASPKCDF